MKSINKLFPIAALLLGSVVMTVSSCSDEWDNHYDRAELVSTVSVEVVSGTVADYLASQSDFSKSNAALASVEDLLHGESCTVIITRDGDISDDDATLASELFALNSVSDVAVSPASLVPGYGIYMQSGKNIWVTYDTEDHVLLNNHSLLQAYKADNGYIYVVDAPVAVQPSIYEYIESLGDDYSLFKEYIKLFEEEYFDAEASIPTGVDEMGNTLYADSVIEIRNTLMDRFNVSGQPTWNMRSESFQSTLFVPNNDVLSKAYHGALDSIPVWLNRASTASDSLKFKKWIVSSCFVDRRLAPNEVSADVVGQFECVGGYIENIDKVLDKRTYEAYEAAQWKPSVQLVDTQSPIELSNGVAYHLTEYKVPNHIVIWRVKEKFYLIWPKLSELKDKEYFRWENWEAPQILNDAQSLFELTSELPIMYYHVLTAVPSAKAMADSLPCSVEYDGLLYNSTDKNFGINPVSLPAGEYYLRMGFKHSLRYSISIYFAAADEEFSPANRLVENMSLIATGSNFHFDRGGAMEGMDFYGSESVGYPEGYNWRFWYDQDPVLYQKASAYDTDGFQVATVNLNKSGNFKIKIESGDMAKLFLNGDCCYDASGNVRRDKSNVFQLMMYHWCLRPTKYNY